jgi:poly-gamma-glutamate capsule biosynthesis protein CapA/YwtB (metallophosphatase superfamily)
MIAHAILDGPLGGRIPGRVRRVAERAVLHSMRFHPARRHVTVSPDTPTASLVAVGDIALHFPKEVPGGIDPRSVVDGVAALFRSADLRVGNLETVFTTATAPSGPAGRWFLSADPRMVETLLAGGFDAVTCANNHALDFGERGLAESLDVLAQHGIRACGAGSTDEEARAPALMQARGLRVGMLGYCDFTNVEGKPGAGPHPADSADERVLADVRRLRERVDLVVLQLHWGQELAMHPLLSHRDRARRFAEAGADVVLCHHAHVIMAVEAWGKSVIAHGLGNFIFGWKPPLGHWWSNRAFVLKVRFNAAGVTSAEIIPTATTEEHGTVLLTGGARREVLGAGHVLAEKLHDDAWLWRVERDCLIRRTGVHLRRLARREDEASAAERAALLRAPHHQRLLAALRSRPIEGGPELAAYLERVAESADSPRAALAAAREAAREPVARLHRNLLAITLPAGKKVGRVP